jgi:hypothetical protein
MTAVDVTALAPYLFGPGNVVSALLVGHGKRAGWVVLVAVQLAMIAFGIATGYWGFTLNAAMAAVGVYNYVRWRRRGVTDEGRGEPTSEGKERG